MTKIRHDNDMIDCTSVVQVNNRTKLSLPIGQDAVYDEERQDTDVTDHTSANYAEIGIEIS